MKIWSLPKHANLTTDKEYCGKEEKLLLRSNFSSFPQYFQYISNFNSRITHIFVECGYSSCFYLNSANLICTDISRYFRESLGIRDNVSRLYYIQFPAICTRESTFVSSQLLRIFLKIFDRLCDFCLCFFLVFFFFFFFFVY